MIHKYIPSHQNEIAPGLHKTQIEGLFYIPHRKFSDIRGNYAEVARIPQIDAFLDNEFVIKQLNISSSKINVIRGFHAENWNKLLTVIDGTCFCAWADFRPDSPTFGDIVTLVVGDQNGDAVFGSMFVSSGIGNSFAVLKGPAHYLYAVDELYANRDESGDVAISVFDPDLDVPWPIERDQVIISDRDLQAISLREAFPEKFS